MSSPMQEPKRLYRQISEQLRGLILAGKFAPGSRLPAERDLSEQLGVSRPSLREALIALEVEGYIEVRMGSGIYVSQAPESQGAHYDLSAEEGPLELVQARALIEGEVAAIAAKLGSKADFDAIEAAVGMMEIDARNGKDPILADRLFHVRIAEATGNSVLKGVVEKLFDQRLGPLFDQLHRHFETPAVWASAIAQHRAVLNALRARNPAQAKAAMRQHMNTYYKELTSSIADAPSLAENGKPAPAKKKAQSASRKSPIAKKAKILS